MNILVTGGAGFIGSHLCEKLIERGNNVFCVDAFINNYDPLLKRKNILKLQTHPNFRLYECDIRDFEKLKNIFEKEKFDTIVHLAALPSVRKSITDPRVYHEINVTGLLNILELAREFKAPKFIFGSSSSVYGNKKVPFLESDNISFPLSAYASTKSAGEVYCHNYHRNFGINMCCLRFFTVYGPRQRPDMMIHDFGRIIDEGKLIETFEGGALIRDFTHVYDIVEGIIKSIYTPLQFEIVNLGGGNPVKVRYVISLLEQSLKRKAEIKAIPVPLTEPRITQADIIKAKSLFGYSPKISIEEGIKNFVNWYKENGN